MNDDQQVQKLLDEVLDTERSPEEVCKDYPELLVEVKKRWQRIRRMQAEVDAMFPTPTEIRSPTSAQFSQNIALPRIEGYDVESILGRGGMGVVFRARHLRLNRIVALKMALAGQYAGQQERERFQREAEAIAGLKHPNIVQIHDISESDGRPYFSMEYVEGGTLAQKLTGTPQPGRQAATLLLTLAEAVQTAHLSGIVHRDLKPANILLSVDGTPKISDFGLARRLDDEDGLTRTGTPLGTPSYMSPEQAGGKSLAVGPAVDIYALGAILYELLTGRPPFVAESSSKTMQQVIAQDPVPPSRLNGNVSRDLETICLKCLHKEPHLRYATAAALADDLKRYLRGDAIAARTEWMWRRLVRRIRRRPGFSALIAVSTLLAIALIGVGVWMLSEREATARSAQAEEAALEKSADADLKEMEELLQKSSWAEARAALERAKGRLGDRGSAQLHTRRDQGRQLLDLAARLDAIRLNRHKSIGASLNIEKENTDYETVFLEAGVGQVNDDPKIVANRIRASLIRDSLMTALDDWMFTSNTGHRKWLEKVVAQVEPTGWRARVLDPKNWEDEAAFFKLLDSAPTANPSSSTLLTLQLRMGAKGLDGVSILKRAQRMYPGDFWINFRLGDIMTLKSNYGEAVGYYRAALVVRPKAALVHNNLGRALEGLGQHNLAVEHYRQAAELEPTVAKSQSNLGFIMQRLSRVDEAAEAFRKAIDIDPKLTQAQMGLRLILMQQGRKDEAREAWHTALEADPPDYEAWYGYAEFCLYLEQKDAYRWARSAILEKFGKATDPQIALKTALACLILPGTDNELRQATALAERAVAAAAAKSKEGLPDFVQGLADYRQGRFDQAIIAMRRNASSGLGPAPGILLAMALHQNGQIEEARKTLAEAISLHDWRLSRVANPINAVYHVLRREAEQMILPNLQAYMEGKHQPQDNEERLAFLGACQSRNRNYAAAKLYADAFTASPALAEDYRAGHRYQAAGYAALAGNGRGEDSVRLDEQERKRWRAQSRKWLRENLTSLSKLSDKDRTYRDWVRETLIHWKNNSDFACLRQPFELIKWSVDERKDCLALWDEVNALLSRVGGDKK